MTQDGVIVDTSVFIEFFKGSSEIAKEVLNLLQRTRVLTTGIILAELLQGIKNPKEEERLTELLTGIKMLEIDNSLWVKAGKLSSSLRRRGINIPLTDIAIAVLAIEKDITLFTLDNHFTKIPDLKLYTF